MRAACKVLNTVVATVGLAVFLPASSSAGTITIVDLANDVISFTTDSGATTARLTTTNCTSESSCIFALAGQTGAATGATTFSATSVNLLEPPTFTLASDTLHNTDVGAGGSNAWSFVSSESGIALLTAGTVANFDENGTAQTVETITYHSSIGGAVVGTDTILIQSDLDSVAPVPEPASVSLLLLGGGLLIAAGRLRKRARG